MCNWFGCLLYLGLLFYSGSFPPSSSLSSKSKDIGNSFGHIFPSGVHIAQNLVCSVFGGMGEVGDSMDGESIGWLAMGPGRLLYLPLPLL